MSDFIIKRVDEIDYYKGEHAIPGIKFRIAGRQLGVTAWGMNILEMEPNVDKAPEHDHEKDGQEEVYVVLRGSAIVKLGDQMHEVGEGTLVRVGPKQKRKFIAGKNGLTLLAIGATPGKAYPTRT